MHSRTFSADWTIVALCFAVLSVSYAAQSLLGLSMPYLERDLGWTRSFLSSGGALALIAMASMSPIAGNMIDRFGARFLLCSGLVAIAAGMSLSAMVHARWQFLAAFGGLGGLGFGMAAVHAVSTIVGRRFDENRGLAISIATAGATAGQLFVVPMLAAVLVSSNWRWSYLCVGLAALAMAALVLLIVRPTSKRSSVERSGGSSVIFAEAMRLFRMPVFHLLLWSYMICGFTTSGVIETHLLPYASVCGFPPVKSATAYGLMSAVNLCGMILAGWLTDRMNRPLLLAAIYFLRSLTFIVLIWAARDISLLFLFAVLFGLFDYSTVPVTASLAASHIGLRVMGLTMGLLAGGHALGAAAGAFLAGLLFDSYGQYFWVWIAAFVLAMLAGMLCLAINENSPSVAGELTTGG
jgi:MFS family permease